MGTEVYKRKKDMLVAEKLAGWLSGAKARMTSPVSRAGQRWKLSNPSVSSVALN